MVMVVSVVGLFVWRGHDTTTVSKASVAAD